MFVLVLVIVMHVRRVGMSMPDGSVFVSMRVRFVRRLPRMMFVLMVLVMDMRMRMHRRFVDVLMFMMLGGVQPHA